MDYLTPKDEPNTRRYPAISVSRCPKELSLVSLQGTPHDMQISDFDTLLWKDSLYIGDIFAKILATTALGFHFSAS